MGLVMRTLAMTAVTIGALLATAPTALSQNAGLPPEVASVGVTVAQWNAVREEVRRRASQARVSEQALLAAAEATGARFASSGKFNTLTLQSAVIEALEKQTEQLADLEARLQRLTGDADPEIARFFAQARAALDAGRLREADRLLADVSTRDLAGLQRAEAETERLRLRAADTIASRGRVALLEAEYLIAANHYGRAAETAPERDINARWSHRMGQAMAFYERGRLFGELEPLRGAERICRDIALPLAPRRTAPNEWAATHNVLGNVLLVIGDRGDTLALQSSIAAYRTALEVYRENTNPVDWATTQNNLGAALLAQGERGDIQAIEGSIAAYRAALRVRTRANSAIEWADTQNNLANALAILGERGNDRALSQAIATYREALQVRTRSRDPGKWAGTMNNLGNVLKTRGARGDQKSLLDAISAYRSALEIRTRLAAPAEWAESQSGLGGALRLLGERGRVDALHEAIIAFRAALTVNCKSIDVI
jgi:tetratricopeptide (TPR) repeat protein